MAPFLARSGFSADPGRKPQQKTAFQTLERRLGTRRNVSPPVPLEIYDNNPALDHLIRILGRRDAGPSISGIDVYRQLKPGALLSALTFLSLPNLLDDEGGQHENLTWLGTVHFARAD
jgi:hypothetical protein